MSEITMNDELAAIREEQANRRRWLRQQEIPPHRDEIRLRATIDTLLKLIEEKDAEVAELSKAHLSEVGNVETLEAEVHRLIGRCGELEQTNQTFIEQFELLDDPTGLYSETKSHIQQQMKSLLIAKVREYEEFNQSQAAYQANAGQTTARAEYSVRATAADEIAAALEKVESDQ